MRGNFAMVRSAFIVALPIALLALTPPASAEDDIAGALLGAGTGAVTGGLATGRLSGAFAGAIVGGYAGSIIGSEAEHRRGHYWWHGDCYRRVRGGFARVSRRYCY